MLVGIAPFLAGLGLFFEGPDLPAEAQSALFAATMPFDCVVWPAPQNTLLFFMSALDHAS